MPISLLPEDSDKGRPRRASAAEGFLARLEDEPTHWDWQLPTIDSRIILPVLVLLVLGGYIAYIWPVTLYEGQTAGDNPVIEAPTRSAEHAPATPVEQNISQSTGTSNSRASAPPDAALSGAAVIKGTGINRAPSVQAPRVVEPDAHSKRAAGTQEQGDGSADKRYAAAAGAEHSAKTDNEAQTDKSQFATNLRLSPAPDIKAGQPRSDTGERSSTPGQSAPAAGSAHSSHEEKTGVTILKLMLKRVENE